jgi:hypothetical protein
MRDYGDHSGPIRSLCLSQFGCLSLVGTSHLVVPNCLHYRCKLMTEKEV